MRVRLLVVVGCIGWLAGCAFAAQPQPSAIVVGSDVDAHGCKASAGYTWCARENACVRPWELARKKGFELKGDGFKRYCAERPE